MTRRRWLSTRRRRRNDGWAAIGGLVAASFALAALLASFVIRALTALWMAGERYYLERRGQAALPSAAACAICGNTLRRGRTFLWPNAEGESVAVCSPCNRRLESQRSADAFKRLRP